MIPETLSMPAPADLSPMQMAAGVLIFFLGLLGLALLARLAARACGPPRTRWRDGLRRLAALPASDMPVWPLIALLAIGSLLTLLQSGSPVDAPAAPPAGVDLAASIIVQHGMILVAVAACLVLAGRPWRDLLGSPMRAPARQAAAAGLRGGLMLLPPVWLLTGLSTALLRRLGCPIEPQVSLLWLAGTSLDGLAHLLILLTSVVSAPIVEEGVFRGLLMPALARRGARPVSGVLLAALLFAALHLHAPSLLPLFAIGVACSIGYAATGHLLTPIVMHAVFNAVSLLAFYVRA